MRKILKAFYILILVPSLLLVSLICKISVNAENGRVVRVGWFESNYNITDDFGRRSGYSYEYQQKLSIYTNWKYEYVSGSWSELLDMLINGELDLLSDVSYTEERTSKMNFSSIPMGTEDYYLYKSPNNNEITNDDYTTFNGKKVGINKGSIMIQYFNEWAAANHITAEVVELKNSMDEAISKLHLGELDLYVSMDGALEIDEAIPLCKIGDSDFYFATRKDDTSLINELNSAMNRLLSEDPYYNQELHAKYFKAVGVNLYLNEEEKAWLDNNKKIKIGYQDNYLAFCAKDPKTNELTGALKDYLQLASKALNNATISFDPISYPTAKEALNALKAGEIDCMFPANLSVYDGEENGLFMTTPIMKTEIVAVMPESSQKSFLKKDSITVAVNSGNPNYDLFLVDNFPSWRAVYFKDTQECLKGIAEGKADCLLISNYRFNNIAAKCSDFKLTALSTGVELDYSFAVNRDSKVLYSILNKIIKNIPESSVNSSISYYYTEDAKVGFGDFISQYIWIIMIILAVIAIIILFLIFRNILIDKKSKSRQNLINETEIDNNTGLYTKVYFYNYCSSYYNDNPDKPMDAMVIYIDHFHSIVGLNGIEFANQILRELGDEIKKFLKNNGGIACHSEDGRFGIYTPHIEDYYELFDKLQGRVDTISMNLSIRLRMGIMPWQPDVEPSKLIQQAVMACSMAMTGRKEKLIIFDEKMRNNDARNQKLLEDLDSAIMNKELEVYYQPKYDISSKKEKLVGAEALLRWNHPEFGMIEPNDFIPLFEKNGQIRRVDRFVRNEVVKQMSKWNNDNYNIPISVNISQIEMLDQTFKDSLDILLDENNIARESLILEVTENAYVDNSNQFVRIIKELKKSGYKIEMDDFGTGYSSLKTLTTLDIDALKIDSTFINDIENNDSKISLVNIILGIAKSLNISVVAEGVENESQLEILKKLGCNIIQGFYFSTPLLADDFEELLKNNK